MRLRVDYSPKMTLSNELLISIICKGVSRSCLQGYKRLKQKYRTCIIINRLCISFRDPVHIRIGQPCWHTFSFDPNRPIKNLVLKINNNSYEDLPQQQLPWPPTVIYCLFLVLIYFTYYKQTNSHSLPYAFFISMKEVHFFPFSLCCSTFEAKEWNHLHVHFLSAVLLNFLYSCSNRSAAFTPS